MYIIVEILINTPPISPSLDFSEYVFYILIIIRIETYNYYHHRTSDEFYIALTYFYSFNKYNIYGEAMQDHILCYLFMLLNVYKNQRIIKTTDHNNKIKNHN